MSAKSSSETKFYLKKKDLFFDSSKLLFSQVTEAFDFIWPTADAMHNLHAQVKNYLLDKPTADKNELRTKFPGGMFGERVDLRMVGDNSAWSKQQQQFAIFLLINSFAFYESWIKNTLLAMGYNPELYKAEKKLYEKKQKEFKRLYDGLQQKDISKTINKLTISCSTDMKNLFYNNYKKNTKNGFTKLSNLMINYRYFKEIRNCIMHNGAVADKKLIYAHRLYYPIKADDLNAQELPIGQTPVLNENLIISIREVVGFFDILLKIVATIDAELSVSEEACVILIKKCRTVIRRGITIKPDKQSKNRQIKSLFNRVDMPTPADYLEAEKFLKSNSLVS